MKSMTGFGAAQAKAGGRAIKIEISSVNSRKGLDVVLNIPRELPALEAALRELAQERAKRGRVQITVSLQSAQGGQGPSAVVNEALLRRYHAELSAAARRLKIGSAVTLDSLLRLPGVVGAEEERGSEDGLVKAAAKAAEEAFDQFDASRAREGKHLAGEIAAQIKKMEKLLKAVEARHPEVLRRFQEQLAEKVRQAGLPGGEGDERLMKEIVIFSDRTDVSEEITRLKAHFIEARRLLGEKEPQGRRFDFLLQEIGREINTIGSKANDLTISRCVVDLKVDLEKIREQAQNLE
jgi:uncharacterized protein (TIGR00255 family)